MVFAPSLRARLVLLNVPPKTCVELPFTVTVAVGSLIVPKTDGWSIEILIVLLRSNFDSRRNRVGREMPGETDGIMCKLQHVHCRRIGALWKIRRREAAYAGG